MKFTPEEVREWCNGPSQTETTSIEHGIVKFLRSKGLLQENKPLLMELGYEQTRGERYVPQLSGRLIPADDLTVRQTALDTARDRWVRIYRYATERGERAIANTAKEEVNNGIREGLWLAPEGWNNG